MENNFDKRSLIGFGVIGLLMFVWMTYFNPAPVEKNKNTQTSNTELVDERPFIQTPVEKSSGEKITLQNNELSIVLNSQGAQIQSVLLKKYNGYDEKSKDHKKPLFLFDGKNSSFNIIFKENGQIINTNDLHFAPTQTANQVSFKSTTPAGGTIEFIYKLQADYLLDFDIKTQGIQVQGNPKLLFNMKSLTHEKGRKYEDQSTKLTYAYNNLGDVETESSNDEFENLDWFAVKGQFFSVLLDNNKAFGTSEVSIKNIQDEKSDYLKDFEIKADMKALDADMHWYLGPNDRDILMKHNREYDQIVPLGWFIFGLFNIYIFIPLFKFLSGLNLFGYGIVILVVTFIVKLITSPIQYKMYKQSAIMRVLKPELDELNEKYKDADALKKQQATMDFYRKVGYNPMAGCLPALIQMPIFLALINLFPNFIDLRGHSFLWADDLSAYDGINLPFNIPFYGSHISLFTLLYAATMFLLYQVQGTPQQPTQEGMPNMKYIMYFMPVMLLFFINGYASGLSWYYFVSNTITILLILIIKRFFIDEDKIHKKLQENKAKPAKKKSKFAEMLDQMQKQQALQSKK